MSHFLLRTSETLDYVCLADPAVTHPRRTELLERLKSTDTMTSARAHAQLCGWVLATDCGAVGPGALIATCRHFSHAELIQLDAIEGDVARANAATDKGVQALSEGKVGEMLQGVRRGLGAQLINDSSYPAEADVAGRPTSPTGSE